MKISGSSGMQTIAGLNSDGKTADSSGGIDPAASFDTILADFKKVASQTPAERAAAAVLKKHGLTQYDFNKLPKAQRDAVQREITEAVRRTLGTDQAKNGGATAGAFA
jgi:hypothetical protein